METKTTSTRGNGTGPGPDHCSPIAGNPGTTVRPAPVFLFMIPPYRINTRPITSMRHTQEGGVALIFCFTGYYFEKSKNDRTKNY